MCFEILVEDALTGEIEPLYIQPVKAPPTKTLSMVFHEATPVHRRRIAPRAIAITLVSPIEPGIRPMTWSQKLEESAVAPAAISPNGVAAEKVSDQERIVGAPGGTARQADAAGCRR